MTSREIRQQFIDFFVQKHGHAFVPSSSVAPLDDPTLLFANAGMNQFKPYFLGLQQPPAPRVANSQKCIRAGGKHNDLDDVGRSRRHHTFFEMLGNWSFGDYFKREAISFAWELLTNVWKLDPARLHATVYAGNPEDGIPADDQAAAIWREIAGLPEDHIHRFRDENFWEMGETGPCGPCTEIFIDRTPDGSGGHEVNGGDPRVMEIWNLVFIQYNRAADRSLSPLPSKHVDTGMGLERLCQVLQNKTDNYATDLFVPLFDAISQLAGTQYGGMFPAGDQRSPAEEAANATLQNDIAFRVIADHARCLTFALTDGALPGNEGRGYVLRRILRRAVRFGRQQLRLHDAFMYRLVPVIVNTMGEAFPELQRDPQAVAELIRDEEISFGRTLDRGIELFEQAAATARADHMLSPHISGADAFRLHDTFGFPVDLTQIMAQEKGLTVDVAEYERLMEEAREKARAGGKAQAGGAFDLPPNIMAELTTLHVKPTDDSTKYGQSAIRASVRAIWTGEKLLRTATIDDASAGEKIAVILDHSNFYSEMGGQVGDAGELHTDTGTVFVVETTRAVGGFVLHLGHVKNGRIAVDDAVTATVLGGRQRTQKNHTATHLANWALREVLGEHVQQKGSLVDAQKLRFDFLNNKPLTDGQIEQVERLVNERIAKNLPVYAENAPQDEALKIHGSRAIFGEKYPPVVRVVSVGVPVEDLLKTPADEVWRGYSVEFCGGTHLSNTAEIEAFTIVAEESVSKGVRRLVAYTGEAAGDVRMQGSVIETVISEVKDASGEQLPLAIAALHKALDAGEAPLTVRHRAQTLLQDLQSRQRQWQKSQTTAGGSRGPGGASAEVDAVLTGAQTFGGIALVVARLAEASADGLRSAMDSIKKQYPAGNVAIFLASSFVDRDKDGNALPAKVNLLAAVGDPLIGKIKAGDWVKAVAPVVGGSGGGRPQIAMAGGKLVDKIDDALVASKNYAAERLATIGAAAK